MKHSTKLKAGAAAIAGSAIAASSASALTSTFTVAVEFFDPFAISQTTGADFGRVISGVATTYTLDLVDTVTPGAGGSSTGGTPATGDYLITDSSNGQPVDITVGTPVADGGVSITAFNCDYNGNTANGASCVLNAATNPSNAGTTLNVGFTINVDGTQASLATAAPTFDITVAYD